MVGKGRENIVNRCKEMCKKYSLERNVTFAGYIVDVEPYWQQASVHLSTSEIEGYPMVLIEAKAHGVPTVMDDLSYLANVQPNTGVIQIPGLDVQLAADRIAKLLTNELMWKKVSEEALTAFEKLKEYDYLGEWERLLRGGRKTAVHEKVGQSAVQAMIKHHLMGLSDIRTQNEASVRKLREKHSQEIKSSEVAANDLKKKHMQEKKRINETWQLLESQGNRFIYGTEYVALVKKYHADMIISENKNLWGEMMDCAPVCSPEVLLDVVNPTVVFVSMKSIEKLRGKYKNSNLTFLPIEN